MVELANVSVAASTAVSVGGGVAVQDRAGSEFGVTPSPFVVVISGVTLDRNTARRGGGVLLVLVLFCLFFFFLFLIFCVWVENDL